MRYVGQGQGVGKCGKFTLISFRELNWAKCACGWTSRQRTDRQHCELDWALHYLRGNQDERLGSH